LPASFVMKSLPSGDRGRLVSPMVGARAKGLASTFLEHDRVGYERQDNNT